MTLYSKHTTNSSIDLFDNPKVVLKRAQRRVKPTRSQVRLTGNQSRRLWQENLIIRESTATFSRRSDSVVRVVLNLKGLPVYNNLFHLLSLLSHLWLRTQISIKGCRSFAGILLFLLTLKIKPLNLILFSLLSGFEGIENVKKKSKSYLKK